MFYPAGRVCHWRMNNWKKRDGNLDQEQKLFQGFSCFFGLWQINISDTLLLGFGSLRHAQLWINRWALGFSWAPIHATSMSLWSAASQLLRLILLMTRRSKNILKNWMKNLKSLPCYRQSLLSLPFLQVSEMASGLAALCSASKVASVMSCWSCSSLHSIWWKVSWMNSVLLASPICMAVTRWQDPRCKSIEVSHNCLGPWSRWLDSLVMLFQSLAITSHLTFFWWQSLELLQWQLLESCRRTLWASPVWCYVCSSFNCSSRQRTYWQKQSMRRRCNRNQKKDLHWCRMFGLAFRWAAFVPLSWIWAAKRSISIEFCCYDIARCFDVILCSGCFVFSSTF